MKRSVVAGLFVTVAMLTSPVFAAGQEDLCQINLQKIADAKVSNGVMSDDLIAKVEADVQQAKAAQAEKTEAGTKKCISQTTQTLQDLQNNTKGGQ